MSDCSVNDDEEFYEPSESDYSLHDESQPNNVTTSTSTGKSLLETEPVHTLRGDPYVIVNTFKILPILEQMLAHISSVLHTSLDNAKTLLIEYNWDQEKLLEAYYSDPEKVLDSSGVSFTEVASHFSSPFICTICFNTVTTAASSISLTCNHSFCTTCFTQYLTIQVDEGPGSVCTLCPQHQCNRRVPCSLFQQLLDENTYDKYTKYVLRTYIDMSKDMRWCPAPGCDLIIAASPGTRATVKCQCGCTFCFACGELSHQPASCRQLIAWNEKCANESETANWILLHTKKCPKCTSRIEKNQGCNHMHCKICKHEFCWICMGAWSEHGSSTGGYYKCNRFQSTGSTDQCSIAKAKAELERYLHYYQRFHAHEQSGRCAHRQKESIQKRSLEEHSVEHLLQAVELVVDCRRVLGYSYVLGYYLSDDSEERGLFEHHQEMLEKNTEKLSEMTETAQVDRASVINMTRVTDKFLTALLETLVDGMIVETENNL